MCTHEITLNAKTCEYTNGKALAISKTAIYKPTRIILCNNWLTMRQYITNIIIILRIRHDWLRMRQYITNIIIIFKLRWKKIDNVLSNKYFITLKLESIEQHFD